MAIVEYVQNVTPHIEISKQVYVTYVKISAKCARNLLKPP